MKLTEAKTPTGHPQSTWPDYTANKQNTASLGLVTNSIGWGLTYSIKNYNTGAYGKSTE